MSEFTEAQIKEAFDHWDKDKGGFIEAAELEEALKFIGYPKDQCCDIAKAMVGQDDTDKDGKISFAEFKKAVEKECVKK